MLRYGYDYYAMPQMLPCLLVLGQGASCDREREPEGTGGLHELESVTASTTQHESEPLS